MARRSGIRGLNHLRRTLRRIDPAITEGVRGELADAAEAIRLDAIAGAPVDEGDLVRSIAVRFGSDRLTAVIGPGARGVQNITRKTGSPWATRTAGLRISRSARRDLMQFFKAWWIEFGTVKMPARPFMGPAFEANRRHFVARVRREISNALERASRG